MAKTPIIYEGYFETRFSDLDLYGHVNSKHFIDIISTVRLYFLKEKLKLPLEEIAARGFGFYMTKSTINYKRPIVGLQKVMAKSHVKEFIDNKVLIVTFEIMNESGSKVFADGLIDFTIVDMKTQRTITEPIPDWLENLFYN